MKPKIIIIEDEPAIADTIVYAIETDNMTPLWASTGNDGVTLIKNENPDLVLLDVGLPDTTGFEVCRNIRAFSDVPVVFLTARSEEIDRIVGLELGADDYIAKPFSPRELTARIRAILRRASKVPPKETIIESSGKNFVICQKSKSVSYQGETLDLSRNEFMILELLLGKPGQIFSRSQIMDYAWEEPDISLDRTVDTHIKNIRNKIKAIDQSSNPIITKRGFGYGISKDFA